MTGGWQAIAHAERLLELGRSAEAEERFRHVLASEPESISALLGLARALQHQDRDEEAVRAARSAVALDPERSTSFHVLADILCRADDPAPALEAAQRGLALAPHDFVSHYVVAQALLRGSGPAVYQAYRAALRAVELAPHSAEAHNLVGLCLDRLGNAPAARRAYGNALAIDPHHALAQNNLAVSEILRGKLGRSARLLRSAAGVDPQESSVHQNLDLVLLILGLRVLWSLLAAAVILGILLGTGAPSWGRMLAGTAYVGLVTVLARGLLRDLPRGAGRWGLGLFGRARWYERCLMVLFALMSIVVLLMAFAPRQVAVGAGRGLLWIFLLLSVTWAFVKLVRDAVNHVRGK